MDTILPHWLGSFYGCDFSTKRYEEIAVTKFLPLLRGTAEIMDKRWFDYHRLHPVQATYYCVECYRRAYDSVNKSYFGIDKPLTRKDFINSREKNSFWLLRQQCDWFGYPYPWFINKAFGYLLESGQFKNHLPRPQHLANIDKEVLVNLAIEWWDMSELIRLSSDSYFNVNQWENSPVQRRHEDWIVKQIKHKTNKRHALKSALYDRQMLRIERAIVEFGVNEVDDAQFLALS